MLANTSRYSNRRRRRRRENYSRIHARIRHKSNTKNTTYYRISPRGFPIKTEKTIIKVNRQSIRTVTKWKRVMMETIEHNYLNPTEWTLENIPGGK